LAVQPSCTISSSPVPPVAIADIQTLTGATAVSVCFTVSNRNPQQLIVVILLPKLPQTADHFTIKQNSKRNDVWKGRHANDLRNYA